MTKKKFTCSVSYKNKIHEFDIWINTFVDERGIEIITPESIFNIENAKRDFLNKLKKEVADAYHFKYSRNTLLRDINELAESCNQLKNIYFPEGPEEIRAFFYDVETKLKEALALVESKNNLTEKINE